MASGIAENQTALPSSLASLYVRIDLVPRIDIGAQAASDPLTNDFCSIIKFPGKLNLGLGLPKTEFDQPRCDVTSGDYDFIGTATN
jgi:hypothetical protein